MASVRYRGRKLQNLNVQRRLQQWENAEQHAATYGYFKKVNFMTSQHRLWENSDSNGGSRLLRLKEEERQRRLSFRRARLAELLAKEQDQYNQELEHYREHQGSANFCNGGRDLNALRQINGELRRREEERRAHEAELRLYHRWKSQQPVLKHVEDRNHLNFVRQAWVDQVEEKLAEEKKKEEEERKFEQDSKTQLALQEKAEQAFVEEKKAEMVQLTHTLQCQMELLRKKEERAKELKAQEFLMQQRTAELERLSQSRKQAQMKRIGLEVGIYFQEQYNLKLKRRAREVQEALEEDQKVLREMGMQLADPNIDEEERRESRRLIDRANSILASYLQVEKMIEKDMRLLFHEEARFFWDKQEKRWKEEQEARSKLMADTISTIQMQIQERSERNRQAQEALLREREALLQHLENGNTELERVEAEILSKKNLKSSLDAQMEDQTLARLAAIKQEEAERQTRLEEMRREEERLLKEFKALNTKYPSHPLNFGRKSFVLT